MGLPGPQGSGGVRNNGGVASSRAGTYANLPAPGNTGAFYYATDREVWYFDNGTSFASMLATANTFTAEQTIQVAPTDIAR